jgi:hypothetical protein
VFRNVGARVRRTREKTGAGTDSLTVAVR